MNKLHYTTIHLTILIAIFDIYLVTSYWDYELLPEEFCSEVLSSSISDDYDSLVNDRDPDSCSSVFLCQQELLVDTASEQDLCPSDDLYPCSCNSIVNSSSISIYCPPEVDDLFDLQQILTNTKFLTDNVYTFILSVSNISGLLLYDAFEPLRIENLILINDRFNSTDNNAFLSSHPTLKYLDMSYNDLKLFYFGEITNMNTLACLNLAGNLLSSILSNVFASDTLTRLSLNDNNIRDIGSFAFANLTQLYMLNLASNRVTILNENSFHFFNHRVDRFTEIYLENNNIFNISTSAFYGLSSYTIDFRNNSIATLWQNVFQPMITDAEYKVTFKMEGNPIVCDNSLKWALNDSFTMDCFDDFSCSNMKCSFLDLQYDEASDSMECRS